MQQVFRILAAAGAAGLVATGLLAAPAMAATGAATSGPAHSARADGPAARLPLSARQMLADRQLHAGAAHATGSVTGLTLAPDGQPLAGICVVAFSPAGARLGVSSASGRYFIAGLALGAYSLRYASCQHADRYLPEWYGGATQRAKAATVRVSQTRLLPLRAVTLRTPAEASPARDVINTSSPAAAASSLATALGLPSAGARSFRQLAEPASAAVTAKDGRIAGQVTAPSHRPLSGICVVAEPDSASTSFSMTRTDKHGRYLTRRVRPGRYFVIFFPGCGNNGNWLVQAYKSNTSPTGVRVRPGKTTGGINQVLKLGGEISGSIANAKGARLGGMCVEPLPTALLSGTGNGAFLIVSGPASANGVYHLHSVASGTYKILFDPCGESVYAPQWWRNAAGYPSARTLRVRPGQHVNGVDAIMHIGGMITGTVTDAHGNPLKGICVNVNNTSDQSQSFFFSYNQEPVTNAAGQYVAEGLPAGKYQLQFDTGCGNNGNLLPATTATISVGLGGKFPDANAVLEPGATVTGTVTSQATGKPLAGICVAMWSDSFNYEGGFVASRATPAGSYVINNQVPPGTYYLEFFGGCGNSGSYGQVAYDSPSPYSPAPVTIASYGQTVAGIDGALPAGATIAGTVTSRGRRLTGICVAPFGGGFQQGFTVSANGRYRVTNLQPGQYLMTFSSGCGNRAQNKAEQNLVGAVFGSQLNPPLVSAPAGITYGINASLVAGGSVSGRVRARSGKTVPYACVNLTGVSGAAVAGSSGTVVNNDGSYDLGPLLPGSYTATFQPSCLTGNSYYENQWYKGKPSAAGATRIKVTAGHTTRAINGALIPGGSIAGTITSGGKPVWGMCVFAQNVSQIMDSAVGGTNKAGHYLIRGLNSGRYELELVPCGTSSQKFAVLLLSRIVRVTAPKRTGSVNVTDQLGGTLAGQVLGDNPATPQSGICVEAFAANGDSAGSYVTSDGGKFAITNLAAGTYYVYLNDPGCGAALTDLAPQWYPAAASAAAASPVTVTAATTTTLPAATLRQDGAIAGTVSATGHGPLSGACVIVTSSVPGQQPVYSVSRGNGGYKVVGLAPGSYQVKFSSGCGASGYKPQWWKKRNVPFGVTLVTVAAGTTTPGISATLHK